MGYFILILSLAMTIIPFTGKLWLMYNSKLKIFWQGYLFILFSILALVFGIIELNTKSKKEILRDKNQANTLNNTKKLIIKLDSGTDAIEQKLIRIDSLNIKLDSLESKTLSSIEKRDQILKNFNGLNKKLERLYDQEKRNILENIPIVKIVDDIKYELHSQGYKIQVLFSNVGGRAAQNLNIDIWFFLTNQNGKIESHMYLSNELRKEDDFPPTKETNKKLKILAPNFPKLNPNDSLSSGYLLVSYNYEDFIIDTTFYKREEYLWRSISLDGKRWTSLPISNSLQLAKYLKQQKMDI